MSPINHLRIDFKQILRDPIMALMMVAPLLLIIAIKGMVWFLVPFILTRFGFDFSLYWNYVFVFTVMMCGALLGIVTGFLMIDERDDRIAELMSVTPLGREGYLWNRLLFAATLSFIYAILGYYVLDIVQLPLETVIFISFLVSCYAAMIGLLIFSFSDDKVKGLTFAKAINALSLFAFTDLLGLKWLIVLSWFFPPYWMTRIVHFPHSLWPYGLALLVNVAWLAWLIHRYWKRTT